MPELFERTIKKVGDLYPEWEKHPAYHPEQLSKQLSPSASIRFPSIIEESIRALCNAIRTDNEAKDKLITILEKSPRDLFDTKLEFLRFLRGITNVQSTEALKHTGKQCHILYDCFGYPQDEISRKMKDFYSGCALLFKSLYALYDRF